MASKHVTTAIEGIGMTSTRTRARLVARLRKSGIRNERVLQALNEVPRHLFVDEAMAHRAYEDTALPIGQGQTISQPYIVARMTELLIQFAETPDSAGSGLLPMRILEIGTGCGYQTAILCRIASEVFSVERIEALLTAARRNLQKLNLKNYRLKHDDGHFGWQEYAPFDAILVTAAAPELPRGLVEQLRPNGRIIAPVGSPGDQRLVVVEQSEGGSIGETIERVNFVPMLTGTTP